LDAEEEVVSAVGCPDGSERDGRALVCRAGQLELADDRVRGGVDPAEKVAREGAVPERSGAGASGPVWPPALSLSTTVLVAGSMRLMPGRQPGPPPPATQTAVSVATIAPQTPLFGIAAAMVSSVGSMRTTALRLGTPTQSEPAPAAIQLSGGTLQFRLLTDDGFDTAVADSAPVKNTGPAGFVTVLEPRSGTALPSGSPITFRASAAMHDLSAPARQLHWHSDRDGRLGCGRSIEARLTLPTASTRAPPASGCRRTCRRRGRHCSGGCTHVPN